MDVLIQFENKPLLFKKPAAVISCTHPSKLAACFRDIENAIHDGYYVAGFLSYEAGYCFEEKLRKDTTHDFPLLCMGVYDAPRQAPSDIIRRPIQSRLNNLRLNISYESYSADIQTIRDYIAQGDVYQITYCIKLLFDFSGDPLSLYAALLREQPVPYPAYIRTDAFHILSLSPEMFIRKEYRQVVTKPMKGTWPRGAGIVSDCVAGLRLKYDAKNRAENVMIADLLRNDLGRIGTHIRAPRLFEVAKYRTLHQMTSTVTGHVDADVSLYAVFASLFPSGSVTGAPKIRAMEIIRELEGDQRRIYTGAIGYVAPNKDIFFNIPIRTLLIRGGSGEMGIGGGIVWDSTPQGEWDEGLLKAKFVTHRNLKS